MSTGGFKDPSVDGGMLTLHTAHKLSVRTKL